MTNPHDEFARYVFGRPECAAAELRAVLPPLIAAHVNWPTLKREPDFEVDPELRESESGLYYSVEMIWGERVFFLLLLKNQATKEDQWLSLRMRSYVQRQSDDWRKAHPESTEPPIIVPIVLYFGKEPLRTTPLPKGDFFNFPV